MATMSPAISSGPIGLRKCKTGTSAGMLSLTQAAARRGAAGQPLPGMYPALKAREAEVCRGQLTLVVGPPSAGKSLFIMNLIARMQVPTLAFMLDIDQLSAAARFGAILTGDKFSDVK